MENKQDPIWKNAMNYGAIVGFILVIFNVVLYLFDMLLDNSLGFVTFIVLIGGIVMGTIFLRDNEQEGVITYPRALASGTLISLFSGIILSFFIYILYEFIDPGLIEKSFDIQEQQLLEKGHLTDDQVEMRIKLAKEITTPFLMAIFTIPVQTFYGFVISLVTSLFLKKEKSPFDYVDVPENKNTDEK